MSLQAPRLDDRSYSDLVEEAIRQIPMFCPEWTDHNPSDPGVTLIELFAWMTDILLYRLNRVPDKHYIKFMELLGMTLREAEPAHVPVTFWLSAPQEFTVNVPNGTTVATTRTETEPAITFTTDYGAEIFVPTLAHVYTSKQAGGEERKFNLQVMRRVQTQADGMAVFESDPPATGDALYLGFPEDLSYHILGLNISVEAVAGGAGIDPDNPPYVWEAMSSHEGDGWAEIEVEFDSSKGFNVDGAIQLHLPQMREATRTEKRAYWIRCRLLPPEADRPTYRASPRLRNITAETWGITLNTSNISIVRDEIIGRSDGSPGQRFYLAHTPVVARLPEERLIIRMNDGTVEEWEEVKDFADSQEGDRHYTLDSMTGELRLAPALPQPDGSIKRYGTVASKNAILEMRRYRHGGGQVGNVARSAINVLKTSLPYIAQVSNREQASGGRDAESLDDCKLRLPGHLRSLGRAVTPADFEYLAYESAPGQISRAHCLRTGIDRPGAVRLMVIPSVPNYQGFISPQSLRLPQNLQDRVKTYLDERRLLGTDLDVLEPEYHWIQTEVRLRASRHYDPDQVGKDVLLALLSFINPLMGSDDGQGWPFGKTLFANDVIRRLLDVPGVDFIRSVRVFRVDESGSILPTTNNSDDDADEGYQVVLTPSGVVASWDHLIDFV